MFIAIVGIDGSGKSTQVELIKNYLSRRYPVKVCKAIPNNRSIIESIEYEDYVTFKETLSIAMSLDLFDAYRNQMDMNDKETIYIWDRYKYCVQAYFLAEQISYNKANILLKQLKTPDIVIWLDADPCIAEERIHKRGKAKLLENADFLSRVQKHYSSILQEVENVYVINCENNSPDDIHDKIVSIVDKYIF